MKKQFVIAGVPISVVFSEQGIIRLKGDRHLWKLMDQDPVQNARLITEKIFELHTTIFKEKLHIRPESVIVEIWGHVYAEYFVLLWKDRLRFRWLNRLAGFVRKRSADIDIGERNLDPNRWFWDLISVLKPVMPPFLPRNISRKAASGALP